MTNLRDFLWRLCLSLGLLVWAVSCSAQYPASSTPAEPTAEKSDPPAPVSTFSPLPTPIMRPIATWTPSQAPTLPSIPTPNQSSTAALVPSTLKITFADNGKNISIQTGQRIELELGEEYDWQVKSDNTAVLSMVPNSSNRGIQGVFQANQRGQASLAGIGNPKCLNATPRCLMPSLLFQLRVSVS